MNEKRSMPFREWWTTQPSLPGYYKDCRIVDFAPVSERYILLTLQIPVPTGGTHDELVQMDELIEVE